MRAGVLLLAGALAAPLAAQPDEQAARGAALYRERCVACHGAAMEGGDGAGALTGDRFRQRWVGRPLARLFETIRRTMPQDDPGTLSPAQAADLTALVLRANGDSRAEHPLTADELSDPEGGFAVGR